MRRIDRLTSIRGIAALHVIVYHCQEIVGGFNLRPWTLMVEKGYLAVDFFFLLSGFILAYVYAARFDRGEGRYGEFLGLRLARIYPVHLVMLLATVAVVVPIWGFLETDLIQSTPWTLGGNALLVQAWGINRKLSWNFPAWSVSAEWFAYLTFPVLLACTRFAAGRPRLALVASIGCVGLLGALGTALLEPGITIDGWTFANVTTPDRPLDMSSRFVLLRVTLEFTAGLLLFRAYAALPALGGRWTNGLSMFSGVALLATMHTRSLSPSIQDPLAVSATALLILSLAAGPSLLGRALEHRAAVYLGETSYSIYMVHGLFVILYFWNLEQAFLLTTTLAGGTLVALGIVGASVLCGLALYHFVEVPARGWLRTLIERRRREAAVASI